MPSAGPGVTPVSPISSSPLPRPPGPPGRLRHSPSAGACSPESAVGLPNAVVSSGMDTPETLPSRRPDTAQIVVGLIILAMGGMLLLDRVAPGSYTMHGWWPFVLIVMGAVRMVDGPGVNRRDRGKRRSGVWLVMVGLWGLVNEWHLFGLTFGTSWPLLVMASGAMMVWRLLEVRAHATTRREP